MQIADTHFSGDKAGNSLELSSIRSAVASAPTHSGGRGVAGEPADPPRLRFNWQTSILVSACM